MKRKYRLMRIMIYERKALENYINSMAKGNWHVDKLGLNYIRFENREDSIHYVVVLNGDIEEKDMMSVSYTHLDVYKRQWLGYIFILFIVLSLILFIYRLYRYTYRFD